MANYGLAVLWIMVLCASIFLLFYFIVSFYTTDMRCKKHQKEWDAIKAVLIKGNAEMPEVYDAYLQYIKQIDDCIPHI